MVDSVRRAAKVRAAKQEVAAKQAGKHKHVPVWDARMPNQAWCAKCLKDLDTPVSEAKQVPISFQ